MVIAPLLECYYGFNATPRLISPPVWRICAESWHHLATSLLSACCKPCNGFTKNDAPGLNLQVTAVSFPNDAWYDASNDRDIEDSLCIGCTVVMMKGAGIQYHASNAANYDTSDQRARLKMNTFNSNALLGVSCGSEVCFSRCRFSALPAFSWATSILAKKLVSITGHPRFCID